MLSSHFFYPSGPIVNESTTGSTLVESCGATLGLSEGRPMRAHVEPDPRGSLDTTFSLFAHGQNAAAVRQQRIYVTVARSKSICKVSTTRIRTSFSTEDSVGTILSLCGEDYRAGVQSQAFMPTVMGGGIKCCRLSRRAVADCSFTLISGVISIKAWLRVHVR